MSIEISKTMLLAKIGEELGVSDWHIVSQDMINKFADATGDHQFIHVDPVQAAQTPLGSTIAHGFLTMSLLPMLAEPVLPTIAGSMMGLNYGINRLRFLTPVKTGSRVRARFVLQAAQETEPGKLLLTYDVTVEIDGVDKPALRAEWLAMTVGAF
jgi:acyl dehydratase